MTDRQSLEASVLALSSPLEPRATGTTPSIEPLAGVQAVLFDIYGTLVISASGDIGLAGASDPGRAFVEAFEAAGIARPPDAGPAQLKAAILDAHAERRRIGVDYPEVDILSVWSLVARSEKDLSRLAVEYECRVNPVWPMPGLKSVLNALVAAGKTIGIVSNAQFYTPIMLGAFLGQSLDDAGFDPDCRIYSYRLLEAKPSQRLYRDALAALEAHHGIGPEDVLYVGNDMRNDIWPASAVGCKTALFAGDARSLRLREGDPCCADVQPDRVVTELGQIVDMLGI